MLEEALQSRFGTRVKLVLTDNRSTLLSQSVAHARAHPEDTRAYLKLHAATRPEWHDDALLDRYLSMYVSELTASMGDTGRAALAKLYEEGAHAGLFDEAVEPVVV